MVEESMFSLLLKVSYLFLLALGFMSLVMLDLNGASCQPIISIQNSIFLKNFEMAKRKRI